MGTLTKETEFKIALSNLLFKEEGMWIAHCLDFDLVCQATTLPKLQERLIHSIMTHISFSKENDFDIKRRPAPEQFWEMFNQSDHQVESQRNPTMPSHFTPVTRLVDMADCA